MGLTILLDRLLNKFTKNKPTDLLDLSKTDVTTIVDAIKSDSESIDTINAQIKDSVSMKTADVLGFAAAN